MAVQQRRLGEGEALAARAGSGRGTAAADCADAEHGMTAAGRAAAFLQELAAEGANQERTSTSTRQEGTAQREGQAAEAQSASAAETHEHEDGASKEAPPMARGSDSDENDEAGPGHARREKVGGRVASRESGQTSKGAPGEGALTSGR